MELALTVFLASLALSAILVFVLIHSPVARWSLDSANHRSLHSQPTPRVGGLAILIAIATAILVWEPTGVPVILLVTSASLAIVSSIDDWKNLPVALRLVVHAAAAVLWPQWAPSAAAQPTRR